jgi:toxin YoeB
MAEVGSKENAAENRRTARRIVRTPHDRHWQSRAIKGDLEGYWSRRINKASRLIYKIEENIITVFVISLKGHYGDK